MNQRLLFLAAFRAIVVATNPATIPELANNGIEMAATMPQWPEQPWHTTGWLQQQQPIVAPSSALSELHFVVDKKVSVPAAVVTANEPKTGQAAMTAPVPRETVTGSNAPDPELWKYIPMPPPMPATTPKYPPDMLAALNSAIESNMAKSDSLLVLKEKTKSDTSAISSMKDEIQLLEHDLKDTQSAIKSIENKKKSAAVGITSNRPTFSLITLTSIVIGFCLAGLAFIL